jgi:hypothetical protein
MESEIGVDVWVITEPFAQLSIDGFVNGRFSPPKRAATRSWWCQPYQSRVLFLTR